MEKLRWIYYYFFNVLFWCSFPSCICCALYFWWRWPPWLPSSLPSVSWLLCWFLTCGLSLGLPHSFPLGGWGRFVDRSSDHACCFHLSLSLLPSPPGQQNLMEGKMPI